MTRLAILVAISLLALPGAASAAERRFSVGSFHRVQVEGDVAVEIVSGAVPRAQASGELRALDALTVEVLGDTLHVRRARTEALVERRARSRAPQAVPLVRVSARDVGSLIVRGQGSARLDRLAGIRPSARVDGDGSIEIDSVKAQEVAVTVTGGGSLKIAGTAASGRAMMLGDGLVEASGLQLGALDFTGEGPVRARLTVNGPARIVANGDTAISVGGKPVCTVRQTGKGRIDCPGAESPR